MSVMPLEIPFMARSGRRASLSENSRLKLFAFEEFPFRQGMVMAVRLGTRQRILTSASLGIKAIHLLQKGKTITQAREELARSQGLLPNQLDLKPVIDTLLSGQFVDRIDGIPVETNRVSKYQIIYRKIRNRWMTRAISSVARLLPLKSEEKVIQSLRWKMFGLPKLRLSQELLAQKFRQLFPRYDLDHCRDLAEQHLRFRLYLTYCFETVKKPQRYLEKWVGKLVDDEVEGLEHLHAAQAGNKGIIFTGYHHGLFWILPPVIYYKLGIRHNVLLTTKLNHGGIDENLVRFFVQDTENIARIGRLLLEGDQNLLMFPDGISPYKPHEVGKMVHQNNWRANATKSMTLFGREIEANKGVSWFHRMSQAPVLPIMLLWRRNQRAKLVIGPPLSDADKRKGNRAARRAYEDQLVGNVYSQLETWVRQYPEQWVNFPKWIQNPQESTLNETV